MKVDVLKLFFEQYYSAYNTMTDLSTNKIYENILPDDYSKESFQHVLEKQCEELSFFAKEQGIIKESISFILNDEPSINVSTCIINGAHTVIFNTGLLYLTLDFSALLIQYRKALDEYNEKQSQYILQKIVLLFQTMKRKAEPTIDKEIFYWLLENNSYMYQTAMLSNALFLFSICHEIGHIVNGDLNAKDRQIEREIKADSVAVHLFFEIVRNPSQFKLDIIDEFVIRAPLIMMDMLELTQDYFESDKENAICTYNEYRIRKINILSNFTFNYKAEASVFYLVIFDLIEELRKYLILDVNG